MIAHLLLDGFASDHLVTEGLGAALITDVVVSVVPLAGAGSLAAGALAAVGMTVSVAPLAGAGTLPGTVVPSGFEVTLPYLLGVGFLPPIAPLGSMIVTVLPLQGSGAILGGGDASILRSVVVAVLPLQGDGVMSPPPYSFASNESMTVVVPPLVGDGVLSAIPSIGTSAVVRPGPLAGDGQILPGTGARRRSRPDPYRSEIVIPAGTLILLS